MRGLLLLPLALAACTDLGGAALAPLDRLTLDELRAEGDDPMAVRPVEHLLLPTAQTDPAGLEAGLREAGFDDFRLDRRPGFETRVVFSSDARAGTIARQIEWLETNAPAYGFARTGWDTEVRPG